MAFKSRLLQPMELKALDDNINIEQVHVNHQTLLDNNLTTADDMDKLITIVGGMDCIFEHCLSKDNPLELTKHQLIEINEVLISINNRDGADTFNNNYNDHYKETMEGSMFESPILHISTYNTFLHDLFDGLMVNKIINVLFDKLIVCCLGLLLSAFIIWYCLASFIESIGAYLEITLIFGFVVNTVIGIYLIFVLLSVNKTIAKTIIKSFQFWFKLACFISFFVCSLFNVIELYTNSYLVISMNILINLIIMLILINLFILDGIQIHITFKIIILFCVSILSTMVVIYWTFIEFSNERTDNETGIIQFKLFHNMSINTFPYALSSLRILLIFIWKQTILTIWKKDIATLINNSVIIRWVH